MSVGILTGKEKNSYKEHEYKNQMIMLNQKHS